MILFAANRAAGAFAAPAARGWLCAAATWAGTLFMSPAASAQHQLSLAPMNLLPDAPSTYQMRDWRQVALDFDALAFNTTATGQFLPIPIRDDTPESPHLNIAYELPSYVGDNRRYGNGETFAEGIPTLGSILGSTLVGVDKSSGPLNWVSMTREYYIDRNNEFIFMNRTDSASGHSAWYDVFPNILFYAIADRYPNEPYIDAIQDQVDSRFYTAVNVMTAGGTAANFNYSAFDFSESIPKYNGTWREPDMGLGMAWMQHAAYWRNRESNPAAAAQHLEAVDWAFEYYEPRTTNPHYEILTSFGAYAAARMNAEHGRNLNVHKYLEWVFSRSAARPDLIMISGEQWGGQDVGGLMGGMRPNRPDVEGYAFAMNTYGQAMPVVPLARYEDRYSRDIGKWMLNAANASRLFYGNAHPPGNQSSEFWTGDPQSSIAYEGLRHHWMPDHLLKPGENEEIYAAGDPLTYGWGPLTDFGIYSSALTGVFGSVVRTTNVEKVLQLDLLATDFYRDEAHQTYLYYNPHQAAVAVAIDLGAGGSYDLYDAVSNRFLSRGATGQTHFSVPADNAVQLVLVPSGGVETMVGRKRLVGDVVIDYNATLLPGNLLANPDVDSPVLGSASTPTSWNRSSSAVWATDDAVSPTHSLKLADNSSSRVDEWRSYATALPEGEARELELSWYWKYDVEPNSEFRARLRFSESTTTGPSLVSAAQELNFVVGGEVADFEHFMTTIALPDWANTFDLSFISGGLGSQLGTLYVDDISVVLAEAAPSADFDEDGDVDGSDFLTWQTSVGSTVAPGTGPDGNRDGVVDGSDLAIWRFEMANGAGQVPPLSTALASVPEPITKLSFITACFALSVRLLGRSQVSGAHRKL
jgi:hypothetical protein